MSSNIFILTADSLSYPHFTGQAATLAEQVNGVNFATAIAPANETRSSMPALATGTYNDRISGNGLPERGSPQPLLEILSENGYDTGLWTDNFLFGESYNYDRGVQSGDKGSPSTKKKISKWIQGSSLGSFFHLFEWVYFNVAQPVADRTRGYNPFYRPAETIHTDVLEWLNTSTGESPVACWVHYMDTHHPFEPPSEYLAAASASTEDHGRSGVAKLSRDLIKDGGSGYSDDDFTDVEAVYQASCQYLSDSVSAFVDDLKRHGHFDPSEDVLVFSADHGESLRRNRGVVGHTPVTFWDDIVRVPFVVARPDWQFGTVTQQVSLVDLVPTVLNALDLSVPDDIDGRVADSPSGLAREVALSIAQSGTPEGVRNYRCARTADGYKLFGCHEGTIRQTHADEAVGETTTATFEDWNAVDRTALAEKYVPSYDALNERGGAIEDQHTSEEVTVPEEHLRNLGYKS